jgi:glycosyltransferase involved in cell wall biosynthesis
MLSSEGVSCYNLFHQLEKFDYQFKAISAQVNMKKQLKNVQAYQTGSFPTSPTSSLIRKYVNHAEVLARGYRVAKKILQKQKIDIIHHMLPAVYNQSFDFLAIYRKQGKQPFVLGPISAHLYPRPVDEKGLNIITSVLHEKTIKNCDQLITVTDQVKKNYSQIFDEKKIMTIPLGVDTQRFKPEKRLHDGYEVELLFAGYLYKLKGIEYLLKALQILAKDRKGLKLRIIGDGPDKNSLVKLAESLKIRNKVIFEGLVPHYLMPRYYQDCDIFCFPTLGEPFGKALIEAMACQKPVISSNVGGPAEIIENEKNGLLVSPADPESLASKITELLDDEKKTKQIAENARKTAVEKYSWTKIAEKYHTMYSAIMT